MRVFALVTTLAAFRFISWQILNVLQYILTAVSSFCRTLDPPTRNNELSGMEPSGRTPGGATAASRHMSSDDLMSAAMSGLDLAPDREPNLGENLTVLHTCSVVTA